MPKTQFSHDDVRILRDTNVYDGFYRMKRLTLQYKRFAGNWTGETQLEVFDRNPVAAVLPYDPVHHRVVLIEQFRVGCYRDPNPWQLEIVAGIIEPGESPETMAHRETIEEAGLKIQTLQKIFEYWTSPGGSTEFLTLYCGIVDTSSITTGDIFGATDEVEDIKVHVLDCDKVFTMLDNGQIRNAASIVALQWLRLNS